VREERLEEMDYIEQAKQLVRNYDKLSQSNNIILTHTGRCAIAKVIERVQELESFKDSAEYTVDTETMELIIANQNNENSMKLKEINYEKIYKLQQIIYFLELKLSDFKEYANEIKKTSDEKMIKDYADRFMGDISETLQALEETK